MRILVLARANYVLAARRADLLRQEGHVVRLLSLHVSGALTECDALGGRGPIAARMIAAVPRINRAIARFRPDLVDAHGATSYGFLASVTARKVPWMLTLYGTDLYDHASGSRVLTWMASRALRQATVIYGSTPAIFDHVESMVGPVDLNRRISMPWGIPLGEPVAQAVADDIRCALGTPVGAFVAVHPRRLSAHWRLEWIIDRLADVASSSRRDVELWLIYPAPTRPEHLLLQRLIERAARTRVRLRDLGPLPYDRLMEHLAAADVFVCAARNEMLANSFLESMYQGATPVVSRVRAFEEASRWHGATVGLADADDVGQWNAELSKVAGRDESAKSIVATRNRAAVVEHADDRSRVHLLLASVAHRLGLPAVAT